MLREHTCIWDNPDYDNPAEPQRARVERGDPPADIDVPSSIWFIPGPSSHSATMIRQEYHEIMLGLLRWMEHWHRTKERTLNQEDMEVDWHSDWWLKDMFTPGDLGIVHAPLLSEMEEYQNPFVGKMGVTIGGGVVLTGLPGIGKSSFLWVVFNLRSAAGLPTLYVADSDSAVLWKDGKGYYVDMKIITHSEIQKTLPKDTWCLVDSHSTLETVPESLVKGHRFIIQAASPGMNRMQWMKKVVWTHYFIMRPWTCGELIAGRQCQDVNRRTADEIQLADFHNLYGGSASDAYSFAHRMTEFETSLMSAFDRLQPDAIKHTFSDTPSSFVPEATNYLLSLSPVDDRKRTVWKVDSPSPHLRDRLLSQLDRNPERARQQWFNLHLRSPCPGSQAVAARMFDGFYHKRIIHGGSWTLRHMVANQTPQSEKQTWRTAMEEVPKVLVAHKEIRVADRKPSSILMSSVPELTFLEWPVHEPLYVGIYYHPAERKLATFDSFCVDGIGHAIAFQASISRRHDASPSGKAWFEERGISKVTYVYVTPNSEERQDSVSLPLEVDLNPEGFYDSVYYMYLNYEVES